MVAMQGLRACLNSRFVLATGMASWFERDSNGSLRASSVAFKPVRRAGMMRWLKPVDSGDLGDFTRDDRFVSARIPRSRNKRTLRLRLSTCLPHKVPGVPKVPLTIGDAVFLIQSSELRPLCGGDYGTGFVHPTALGRATTLTDYTGARTWQEELFYPWGQQWAT